MQTKLIVYLSLILVISSLLGGIAEAQGEPNPVADLSAEISGTSVILTWTHTDSIVDHYEVWWSDNPYAQIGDPGMVRVASVPAPADEPTGVSYLDSTSAVGNDTINSFYTLRSVSGSGQTSLLSNRTGEFDFGISGSTVVSDPILDHCGLIDTYTIWGPNAVHRLDCSVTVAHYAELVVLPGTVVKFTDSGHLSVEGVLTVEGSAWHPAIFTSITDDAWGGDTNGDASATSPAPGDWSRITVEGGGESNMSYAKILYGGSGAYGALYLHDDAYASLNRSLVMSSLGRGIYSYPNSSHLIMVNSKVSQSEIYLRSPDTVSIVNSTIQNSTGDGIYLRSPQNVMIRDNEIVANGQKGIYIKNGDQVSIIRNTFEGNETGLLLVGVQSLTIDDNDFEDNASYPLYVVFEPTVATVFNSIRGNTADNNGFDAIGMNGTIGLGRDTTLPAVATLPYMIAYHFYIDPFGTLTLEAGTVIKVKEPALNFQVYGQLDVNGTSDQPVIFTSAKDDSAGGDTNNDGGATLPSPGDWSRITVEDGGVVSLTHAHIRYSGNGTYGSLHLKDSAFAELEYSKITDGSSYGIYTKEPTTAVVSISHTTIERCAMGVYLKGPNGVSIVDSVIRYNTGDGIRISGLIDVTITGNKIYGNGGYGLYNGSGILGVMPAKNNWWGNDRGPDLLGGSPDINFPFVDYDPWMGRDRWVKTMNATRGPTTKNQAFEADPVNTANGNYSYSYTDLSVSTRGLPLSFTRTYNSLDPQPGPLGHGWTHTWHSYLTEYDDDVIMVTFGDGHGEKWNWTGSGYEGASGIHGDLVKNGDNTYDLTQKNQTLYHFDTSGKLVWVEDKNGNRTTLSYDGSDRLTTVTEPAGRTLTFAYTSPISIDLISSVTDPLGRAVSYTYDANEDLVTVTDVMAQDTDMTYDANHRMLTTTDANSHTFITNVYDSKGRVVEQYDASNNLWTFAYDEPAHKTIVTNPKGHTTSYDYDGDWRLETETDALTNTLNYSYDADSNRTQVVDRRGYATDFSYDNRGNPTTITDALSRVTSMTYDSRNNLLTLTDANSRTTTHDYDAHSNLIERSDALSNVTTWVYDSHGQMTATTDANNHTTSYTYDSYGNPDTFTDAANETTDFNYDIGGRKLDETDPLGRVITYTYDDANRLLMVNEPLGKTTSYGYDLVGNRSRITNPEGGVTTFLYDEKDRLESVTDALSHTTTYTYDSVDNQTVTTLTTLNSDCQM